MTNPNHKVVLGFFAHPDDAEMFAGGTLILLADLGWEIHIATASAGDCGSATLPQDEIAAIRKKEGAAAAASIGGTYHCLEEKDMNIVFQSSAIKKTIDLFRTVNPSLVLTHPRHDYIPDHEQVHLLARAAAFGFAIPNASKLPLPQIHTLPHLYYADPIEGIDPYTGQQVEETTLIDISDVIEKKSDMLACHVSQRDWLRDHHGIDEYLIALKRFGEQRGKPHNINYAEAFTQHKGHPFPQDDILKTLLT